MLDPEYIEQKHQMVQLEVQSRNSITDKFKTSSDVSGQVSLWETARPSVLNGPGPDDEETREISAE